MRKRYNTPHRSRVVKTRMTEEEYAEFAQRLSAYNMSQAEFIRQAITGAAIRPIITVSPDVYKRQVIHYAAINAWRDRDKRRQREISFESVSYTHLHCSDSES